jgi:hypothetical protein
MRLVRDQDGHSIAVYRPSSATQKKRANKLIANRRADFIAPADYSKGKLLDKVVRSIIDKVAANNAVIAMRQK